MEEKEVKMKLLNSISLNMLPQTGAYLKYTPVRGFPLTRVNESELNSRTHIRGCEVPVDYDCCIGHQDLCNILTTMVRERCPDFAGYEAERKTVQLTTGEKALVAQYVGERLPEGATKLPQGAKISFFWVEVISTQHIDKLKSDSDKMFQVSTSFSEGLKYDSSEEGNLLIELGVVSEKKKAKKQSCAVVRIKDTPEGIFPFYGNVEFPSWKEGDGEIEYNVPDPLQNEGRQDYVERIIQSLKKYNKEIRLAVGRRKNDKI